jgi:hypothetical protein
METLILKIVASVVGLGLTYLGFKYILRTIKDSGKTEAYLEIEKLVNENSKQNDQAIQEAKDFTSELTDSELRAYVTGKLQQKRDKTNS